MRLNIAVVHDQVLGKEVLEGGTINNVKLAVTLQPIHHVINALLKLVPVLLVHLHLGLSHAQIFIELLQIIMIVYLVKLVLLRNLR